MRKILNILFFAALFAGTFSSCTQEEMALDGQGKVNLRMFINSDIEKVGRSTQGENLEENCTIYIYSSKGLIRKFHGVDEIPTDLWLVSGEYRAEAWAGDSVSASFDKKFYKGSTLFTVSKDAVANAVIECKIANAVASVDVDESVNGVLSNYKVTIANSKGSLDFTAANATDTKGYFMMPSANKTLTWTVSGTMANGVLYTQSGTIENAKPATEYALKFAYDPTTSEVGGGMLTVTIDETVIEVPDNIEITGAPKILGFGFDIATPMYSEVGNLNKFSIWVSAVGTMSNIEMTCSRFTSVGLPVNALDFMIMTPAAKLDLAEKGLDELYVYDDVENLSNSKITFNRELLNKFTEGEYIINIKAIDSNGKSRSAVLKIVISDAPVLTKAVARADIWAKRVTLYGDVAKAGASEPGFNYRKKGEQTWTSVQGVVSGSVFSAKLTDLIPGTTYQVVATSGDYVGNDMKEFTTESAYAIPNGGFESWHTASNSAVVPMPEGLSFWDSGNHGSITLGVNVTAADNTIKNSGEYSAKLASQFVGVSLFGKFAAGNLFSGVFGKVTGTNASMTFGIPYSGARPTKMVGYYKYISGTVTHSNTNLMPKGEADNAEIFIALSDKGSPWNIDSGTESFFNKDAADIVAYGNMVRTTSTEGEGMLRFEIPITYRSTVRIPNHIIVVAAASRYGDYFTGSTSSVLWIDDIELIYE